MDKINLIFDCDGTLVDSYEAIVDKINRLFVSHNINYDKAKIKEYCLYSTVDQAIGKIGKEFNLNKEDLMSEFKTLKENLDLCNLFPNVKDVLNNDKFNSFVYTHRGVTTKELFEKLEIDDLFIEIVTAQNGFKRKPDPEAINYLVDKYHLDKNNTYYVGDRLLDIECGNNGHIKTIFFNSGNIDIDKSKASYIVNDLKEIIDIFND